MPAHHQNYCKSCLRPLAALAAGQLAICRDCWERMSPAERANLTQMSQLTDAVTGLAEQLNSLLGEARRQFEDDDKPPFWMRN